MLLSPVTGTTVAFRAAIVIVRPDTMLAFTPASLYRIRLAIRWPRLSIEGLRTGRVNRALYLARVASRRSLSSEWVPS